MHINMSRHTCLYCNYITNVCSYVTCTVYCVESENLCGLIGESFEAHSGKDAIRHIIDTYNNHDGQRSENEVNGTGDEWWNYTDRARSVTLSYFLYRLVDSF